MMKHLLSIEQLSPDRIQAILRSTADLKKKRALIGPQPLAGQTWALIFSKPSTRTRVSFEVGIRELGGSCIYINPVDAQLGRGELIKDTARVLARMIHGAIIRAAGWGCLRTPLPEGRCEDAHHARQDRAGATISDRLGKFPTADWPRGRAFLARSSRATIAARPGV